MKSETILILVLVLAIGIGAVFFLTKDDTGLKRQPLIADNEPKGGGNTGMGFGMPLGMMGFANPWAAGAAAIAPFAPQILDSGGNFVEQSLGATSGFLQSGAGTALGVTKALAVDIPFSFADKALDTAGTIIEAPFKGLAKAWDAIF